MEKSTKNWDVRVVKEAGLRSAGVNPRGFEPHSQYFDLLAQWLERPPSKRKVLGSIPRWVMYRYHFREEFTPRKCLPTFKIHCRDSIERLYVEKCHCTNDIWPP